MSATETGDASNTQASADGSDGNPAEQVAATSGASATSFSLPPARSFLDERPSDRQWRQLVFVTYFVVMAVRCVCSAALTDCCSNMWPCRSYFTTVPHSPLTVVLPRRTLHA